MIEARRATALLTVLGLTAVACDGPSEPPLAPDPGPDPRPLGGDVSLAMTCTADIETLEVGCQGGDTSTDGLSAAFINFGGQGENVLLTSSNTSFDDATNILSSDVTIQNLLPQEMGTPDPCCASDIFVFFHTGPSNGVTVANPDSVGTFSGSNQPAFIYNPVDHFRAETSTFWLDPDETSGSKTWQFDTSGIVSGTTFTFSVFVKAEVPHPDGFVQVTPNPAGVETNGTVQLTATVLDVVGNVVSGRTINWSTANSSLASVDQNGLVSTGSTNRAVTITAESDGPEDPGTSKVSVSAPLSDDSPILVSDGSGGELFYVFTVPGSSSAVRAPNSLSSGQTSAFPAGAARAWGTGVRRSSPDAPAPSVPQLSTSAASARLFSSHVASMLALAIDSTEGTSATTGAGADIYVRAAGPPTTRLWDCRPFFNTHNEACVFDGPTAGSTWWVMVRGGEAYTDVLLVGDHENSNSGFSIELDFRGSFTDAQKDAMQRAADRWSSVITGDLRIAEGMNVGCAGAEDPDTGIREVYDINQVSDDQHVVIVLERNDGVNGVLASAGECARRSSGMENAPLPLLGIISVDEDDLSGGLTADTANLRVVMTHELGHTLGFPGLWSTFGLLDSSDPNDPRFTGNFAVAEWQNLGGSGAVPVQPTVEAHWDEGELGDELMTPATDGAPDPLSAITVEQFHDLTYTVDASQADPYSLPTTSSIRLGPAQLIKFGDDLLRGPITIFDLETGRIRTLRWSSEGFRQQ